MEIDANNVINPVNHAQEVTMMTVNLAMEQKYFMEKNVYLIAQKDISLMVLLVQNVIIIA